MSDRRDFEALARIRRARSEAGGIPSTIDDDGSIPVYVVPGTPPPPPNSRIRHYTTPNDYAEAEHRRMERMIRPTVDRLAAVESTLGDHIRWVRSTEAVKADRRLEEHQEFLAMKSAVDAIAKVNNAATAEKTRRHQRIYDVLAGLVIAAMFARLVAPLL